MGFDRGRKGDRGGRGRDKRDDFFGGEQHSDVGFQDRGGFAGGGRGGFGDRGGGGGGGGYGDRGGFGGGARRRWIPRRRRLVAAAFAAAAAVAAECLRRSSAKARAS